MAPNFNPWRFDSVAIPPDLRREIIETELPVIPSDRLYAHPPSDTAPRTLLGLRPFTLAALVLAGVALAGWWMSS